jgi:hypothetical protein
MTRKIYATDRKHEIPPCGRNDNPSYKNRAWEMGSGEAATHLPLPRYSKKSFRMERSGMRNLPLYCCIPSLIPQNIIKI